MEQYALIKAMPSKHSQNRNLCITVYTIDGDKFAKLVHPEYTLTTTIKGTPDDGVYSVKRLKQLHKFCASALSPKAAPTIAKTSPKPLKGHGLLSMRDLAETVRFAAKNDPRKQLIGVFVDAGAKELVASDGNIAFRRGIHFEASTSGGIPASVITAMKHVAGIRAVIMVDLSELSTVLLRSEHKHAVEITFRQPPIMYPDTSPIFNSLGRGVRGSLAVTPILDDIGELVSTPLTLAKGHTTPVGFSQEAGAFAIPAVKSSRVTLFNSYYIYHTLRTLNYPDTPVEVIAPNDYRAGLYLRNRFGEIAVMPILET